MDKIKSALHVNGNILAETLTVNLKMGGGITTYASSECIDLSEAIVIEGDLHVQSLNVGSRQITCSGEVSSYSFSEVDAAWE